MERESWRQIIDGQNDLPETDTGEQLEIGEPPREEYGKKC